MNLPVTDLTQEKIQWSLETLLEEHFKILEEVRDELRKMNKKLAGCITVTQRQSWG
jgi:hypothetical protein